MKAIRLTSRQTQMIGWSLIACHLLLTAFSAWVHAPVVDEIAYMPAGISHWQFADFHLYRANPPLVRMVGTVPAMLAGYQEDWSAYTTIPGQRSEFRLGMKFFRKNREHGFWLVTLGRWMCLPFSLIGALVCWRWSTELYGRLAGLLSLLLWCFCPNILGNASLLTPDVAGTSLALACLYAYWKWSRKGTWQAAGWLGVWIGFALLTKFTSLLLVVMIGGFFSGQWLLSWPSKLAENARVVQLFSAGILALLIVNLCFGFQGSFRPLGEYQFTSRSLTGKRPDDTVMLNAVTGNRFKSTMMAPVPVPLPEQFVLGIDVQKAEFDREKPAFLLGTWQFGGWWYYYCVCLLLKVPLGLFPIFMLCCVGILRHPRQAFRRDFILIVFMVASMYFISANTGVNRHFRYLLPVLGAFYVLAGASTRVGRNMPYARWMVLACGGLFAIAGLSCFPHSQSYFNYLAGGWRGGHRYLQGSNVEWGQDLFFLKHWLKENANRSPIYVAWPSTYIPPSVLDLKISPPPADLPPGWYVVPFKSAFSRNENYAAFRNVQPAEYIGHSIGVYHITSSPPKTLPERN